MKITLIRFYNGAFEKAGRIGASAILFELLTGLSETRISLEEKKDANSGKVVRESIDAMLEGKPDWTKTVSGDLDWMKEKTINGTARIRVGVEIQVSARSDLVIRDLMHIRKNFKQGIIDMVVLVVPSDLMSKYLPDRAPTLSETLRYIEEEFQEIQQFPLVLISIEHDGAGVALPKQKRRA